MGRHLLVKHCNGLMSHLSQDAVADVHITPDPPIVPEFSTVTLSCGVSQGTDLTFSWTYNGSPLSPSSTRLLSNDNKDLTIVNVTREDGGSYLCNVSNPVSEGTDEFTLSPVCKF